MKNSLTRIYPAQLADDEGKLAKKKRKKNNMQRPPIGQDSSEALSKTPGIETSIFYRSFNTTLQQHSTVLQALRAN